MLNHLHLMVRTPDAAGFVRDFKRYTSRELKRNLGESEPNVLKLFVSQDGRYQFWKEDNAPKVVATQAFFRQKMQYIHFNPVRKGYVEQPEHWKWPSVNPASPITIDANEPL